MTHSPRQIGPPGRFASVLMFSDWWGSPVPSPRAAMALCVSAIVFNVPPIRAAMFAITCSSPIVSLSRGVSVPRAGAADRPAPTIPLLGKSITPELLLANGTSITGTVVSNEALTASFLLAGVDLVVFWYRNQHLSLTRPRRSPATL